MQITLEEVEVVFGSGAGARVKQAMGMRRASLVAHEVMGSSDEDLPDQAVTLNGLPKLTRRRKSVDAPELKSGEV